MKFVNRLLIAPALVLAVGTAYADTSTSNKGKAAMEKNAYPSAPQKQEEERTQAHSQPDSPKAGATKARKTAKNKAGKSSSSDASVGSSASARNKAATAKDGQNKPEQGPPLR